VDVTDTSHETRDFPPIRPIDAPPEMAGFITAMRRLQDIVVSSAPDGDMWTDGARRICPASAIRWCRRGHSPSTGPTASPCRVISAAFTSAATTPVRGVIPLFFDWHFGMIVSAADRPISRTAYLHVDYKKVTPIDEPLVARGRIDRVEARKAFITAEMTDADGTVLSEANGLMIKLLPHQP
jgi:hypothetical protein